jgi:hypothetical protein
VAPELLGSQPLTEKVFAASEGQTLTVARAFEKDTEYCIGEFQAQSLVDPALTKSSVILGIADLRTGAALFEAIQAEGIHAKFCGDPDETRKLIAEARPSLAILEHDPPRIDGIETCPMIPSIPCRWDHTRTAILGRRMSASAGYRHGP